MRNQQLGHADVPLGITNQKKSTHIGAIAGGVVGGLAALILLGSALFMFRRRLTGRPLEPTKFGAGHVRLPSDVTQMTSGTSLGNSYQGMNGSFVTSTVTAPRTTTRTESDSHSFFGSVAHSDAIYSSASPPPRGAATPLPANTQTRNRQDIVVPFAFGPDPTHQQGSRVDRKRADRAWPSLTPISHVASAAASNNHPPSRPRINPPAYTEVMSTASQPGTPVTHVADASFSADSTWSGFPTTTAPGASGVGGLYDVVGHVRRDRLDTGGTLATGMSAQLPSNPVFRPFVENPDPGPI